MLSHPNKKIAARLLLDSKLLAEILPDQWSEFHPWEEGEWPPRLEELGRLPSCELGAVVAVLLRSYFEDQRGLELLQSYDRKRGASLASQVQTAWRLTNDQRDSINWINKHWRTLGSADKRKWSDIQPLLVQSNAPSALNVATAVKGPTAGIELCQKRLNWPPEKLNPPCLIDGAGLIELGIKPGPEFKSLLDSIRAAQLDGIISSRDQAESMALQQVQL